MGVPKFFRYISERYPCLSEVVKEYQIPEFDNLYLDMNGIIHMCSHPDDNNPHFRITEERIFKDIFHYIEVLFRMIRPQKLFFMAVDGVAPRAKMNQQRGRRFRSAKEADKMEAEALKKGEKLPSEARFDSNCITPGTEFMARLHEQLQYFINEKISHDILWQKCTVVLSGHETPGEGEHKIMDYIRYMRSQPNHDPNTRHCLYGLDADLIMLGLCTHEPHFSLLREQVTFGRKSTKRQSVPEEITFYLLHLSLMREYLELEFSTLQDSLKGFDYDFEKIIDDWVLMGFLVGNDFIPNLPHLSIKNGALPILYDVYKKVLPTLDGYINESGTLNLARFEKFMEKLSEFDFENFEEIRDDLLWMEAKTGKKSKRLEVENLRDLESWMPDEGDENFQAECLEPQVADRSLAALIKETDNLCLDSDDGEQSEEDDAFQIFKNEYYRNKLEYDKVTPEVMRDQAEGYVRAIQWNLNYYYNGVCSWSWYYPHHYAPYISDIKGFSNLKIEFELGEPFKPYEQLLAVLPAASRKLLPECFQHLMTDDFSPIKQYYPEDFQTDLNGKQQEWEAVVLVPFIEENLLLEAMRPLYDKLTDEEKKRNTHGPMLVFNYTPTNLGIYKAPNYFPTIPECHAGCKKITNEDIRVPIEKLVKGAYPGVKVGVYYPGFPTFKHLKYKGELMKAKVKVFEQPSRGDNMIIKIIPNEKFASDSIPADCLGETVYVGWPHLVEAKVIAISNAKRKYIHQGGPGEYNVEERTGPSGDSFNLEIGGILEHYKTRLGIECGDTKVVVYVQLITGRKYVFLPDGRMNLEKQFTHEISIYPLQCVVLNARAHDSSNTLFRDVAQVFPEGSICFSLANPYYGSQGKVLSSKDALKNGRISVSIKLTEEPDFSHLINIQESVRKTYKSLFNTSSQLGLPNYVFSRITGSIYVRKSNESSSFSIGLELKQSRKNREVPGYTKKIGNVWFYTDKAVELVKEYRNNFPEVFLYLSKNYKIADIMIEDIFPENTLDRLQLLQDWLRNLPSNGVDRLLSGHSALDEEIVKELERIVDNVPTNTPKKSLTMHIKPSFIYRPEVQCGTLPPDSKADVKLLDRIVNVRQGFSVPFGLKGTVVGMGQENSASNRDVMYDIVFDIPFKDGLSIKHCSEHRGYRLPIYSFINISYGKRLYEQKVGKPGVLLANAEAHKQNQQSAPSKSFGQSNSAFASFNGNGRMYSLPNQSQNLVQNHNHNSYKQNHVQRKQESSQYQSYAQRTSKTNHLHQNYSSKVQSKSYNSNRNSSSIQNCTNSFMPDFTMKPEKDINEFQQKREMSNKNLPNTSQNNQIISGAVNTEMLKNWLKIDTDKKEDRNPDVTKQTKPVNKRQETDKSGNVMFEMFAKAAQAPATVQLLTYYASNGLGVPIYLYSDGKNSVQARIKLQNGQIISGDWAKNRDEASENVAATALHILLGRAKSGTELPSKSLPDPPQVWVKNNHQLKNNIAKSEVKNNAANTSSQNGEKNAKSATANNAFIPLQVIKHRNKSGDFKKDEDTVKVDKNITEDKKICPNKAIEMKPESNWSTTQNSSEVKPRRKIKIAANFNIKP